jgi:FAD synthetase
MDKFVFISSKRYYLDLRTIRTNPRPGHYHQTHHDHHRDTHPASTPSIPNLSPEKRITIRDAFATYLSPSNTTHHSIKAIFVGTRRTDPHGQHLTHFDRTDHGWPDFMRIHPVIDWRLSEIWCFLRADELKEPNSADGDGGGAPLAYCEMYDEGYTSLGGVGDTVRNPRLRYLDEDGRERYRPAYELTEDGDERLGRQ